MAITATECFEAILLLVISSSLTAVVQMQNLPNARFITIIETIICSLVAFYSLVQVSKYMFYRFIRGKYCG